MKTLRSLRTTLRENWRTYILLSVATYGALVVMMTVTSFMPGMREEGGEGLTAFTDLPGLSAVVDAYASGNVIAAALLTFTANLFFAAVLTTTLPSLIIPFFAVVATVGACRPHRDVARPGFLWRSARAHTPRTDSHHRIPGLHFGRARRSHSLAKDPRSPATRILLSVCRIPDRPPRQRTPLCRHHRSAPFRRPPRSYRSHLPHASSPLTPQGVIARQAVH